MRTKGFTLLELILVIALIGVVMLAVLPRFFELSSHAEALQRDGLVGAVRAGIARVYAVRACTGTPGYPETLDAPGAHACDEATPCFSAVVPMGAVDARQWIKSSDAEYIFTGHRNLRTVYVYTVTEGTFVPRETQ